MKKVLFIFGIIAMMSACGQKSTTVETVLDSIVVDSIIVDSITIDSVMVDSVK